MMNKDFTKLMPILIGGGIVIEVALYFILDGSYLAKGPIIFWGIAAFGLMLFVLNIFRLGTSIKARDLNLFRRNSIFGMVTNRALRNAQFKASLNENEKSYVNQNKTLMKYLVICFVLFGVTAMVAVSGAR